MDVPRTLEYLAYLGYMYENESQLSAIEGEHFKEFLCSVYIFSEMTRFPVHVKLFLNVNI